MKGEVKDMENLLRFNNVKESLSVITGGMTDKFLVENLSPIPKERLVIKQGSH